MPPVPRYELRCPIHGTIPFNHREKQILDHPFFQRLRHISQLGFASYVYTGATHSRLGHSLGVMYLSGQIFDRLVADSPWLEELFTSEDLAYFRQIVRFAALLHDVGHPPFSHSSELILPFKKFLDLPHEWYRNLNVDKQATHEDFSIATIYAFRQESPPLLSAEEAQDVCSLIEPDIEMSASLRQRCRLEQSNERNIHPLLKNIIGGEIDADRMDYLMRDSYYAGVNYGKFDINHLVRSLSCVQTEQGIGLVLKHKALHTYEDFLLARLHMFFQVYLHKTILPFDYFLQRSLEAHEIDFAITGTLENFLMAREDSMLSALWQAQNKKWASRIVLRKPAKRLFQFEHYHPADLQQQVLDRLAEAGIETLFIQSDNYLSLLTRQPNPKDTPLLVKKNVLGTTQYLPIQKVSLLLGQYHRTADVRYLYCEHKDYRRACDLLIPLLF